MITVMLSENLQELNSVPPTHDADRAQLISVGRLFMEVLRFMSSGFMHHLAYSSAVYRFTAMMAGWGSAPSPAVLSRLSQAALQAYHTLAYTGELDTLRLLRGGVAGVRDGGYANVLEPDMAEMAPVLIPLSLNYGEHLG